MAQEVAANPVEEGYMVLGTPQQMMERQRKLNSAKRPAYIPDAIKKESKKLQVYVFNVGPKLLEGNGSSYGRMMIKPCPEGEPHGPALTIPGLPHEYYNKEGNTLDVQFHGDGQMTDPGWDFACQVIGGYTDASGKFDGKFLTPSNSLEKFGVGISRTWPPLKADVELAKRKMLKRYAELCEEANEAHAMGRFSTISTDDHFVAARALNKTPKECGWLQFSAAAQPDTRESCPMCGEACEGEAVVHKCGFILDKKRYEQMVKDGLIAGK